MKGCFIIEKTASFRGDTLLKSYTNIALPYSKVAQVYAGCVSSKCPSFARQRSYECPINEVGRGQFVPRSSFQPLLSTTSLEKENHGEHKFYFLFLRLHFTLTRASTRTRTLICLSSHTIISSILSNRCTITALGGLKVYRFPSEVVEITRFVICFV